MKTSKILLLLIFSFSLKGCSQDINNSDSENYAWAKNELKLALSDSSLHNVINQNYEILSTKAEAISFAETILFRIYGEKNIKNERPYRAGKVQGYWVIEGTLPEGWKGGTFLIIMDAHNCRIIRVTHWK